MKKDSAPGSCFIVGGLILGLVTAACFLLILGAAVGIGMGGGLQNPKLIITGFAAAGGISVISIVVGIFERIAQKPRDP